VNEISLQASSGGISAIYPRPDWQKDAVAHYLATAKINTPGYTGISREIEFPLGLNDTVVELVGGAADRPRRALSGRGVPDVAAVGSIALNCDTSGGKVYQCGGTSSSAEIVGAIITRINDLRLAAGKPVVGYIHPTIYKHPEMFHDISEGPNNAGNGECKEPGYPPAVGWDPITGLGTFNFAKAAKVFLSV
jgi:tripeptidyl-peptidase-1